MASALTPREAFARHLLQRHGELTSQDLAHELHITRQRAHALLRGLVTKGYAIKQGRTRGSIYLATATGPSPEDLQQLLEKQRPALERLVKKYKLSFLALFGSHARGKTHARSDIDIGYREQTENLTYDQFVSLSADLEDLVGREIDLRPLHPDNPYFFYAATHDAKLLAGDPGSFVRAQLLAAALFRDAQESVEPIQQAFMRKRLQALL